MSALSDQLPRPRSSPTRAGGTGRGALNRPSPLLQVGGGLGLVGVLTGFTLLIFSCAGFYAALYFCPAVIVLGLSGGVLSFLSTRRSPELPDSSTLAALFLAWLAIFGGMLELTALMHWSILFTQH